MDGPDFGLLQRFVDFLKALMRGDMAAFYEKYLPLFHERAQEHSHEQYAAFLEYPLLLKCV